MRPVSSPFSSISTTRPSEGVRVWVSTKAEKQEE